MELLLKFLTILAWIGAVGGFIVQVAIIYYSNWYNKSTERLMHRMQGYQLNFSKLLRRLFVVFIISLAFLIAKGV